MTRNVEAPMIAAGLSLMRSRRDPIGALPRSSSLRAAAARWSLNRRRRADTPFLTIDHDEVGIDVRFQHRLADRHEFPGLADAS